MKKVLIIFVAFVFTLSGWSAYGHGETGGMTGSTGMMGMMDLMHDQMDANQSVDCDAVSDMEMMEEGEDMMDIMLGHEDHERIEEAMEVDMKDHDSMHMMMGMWSSGCVGDEAMGTLATRYGFSRDDGPSGQTPANWSSLFLGVIIGAAGIWAVGKFANKKPVVSGTV